MRWHCHNVKRSFRWCMCVVYALWLVAVSNAHRQMWYTMRNICHEHISISISKHKLYTYAVRRKVEFQSVSLGCILNSCAFFFFSLSLSSSPPLSPFSSFISFSGAAVSPDVYERCVERCVCRAPNEILILAIDRFIVVPSHLNVG